MLFFSHLCGMLVNRKLSQLRICEEFDHLPFWIVCAFHVFCWACHYCLWHGANPVIALIGISALARHEFSRELAENAACWQACPFTESPASLPVLFVSVSPVAFLLRGLSLAKHSWVPLLHMPPCRPGPCHPPLRTSSRLFPGGISCFSLLSRVPSCLLAPHCPLLPSPSVQCPV